MTDNIVENIFHHFEEKSKVEPSKRKGTPKKQCDGDDLSAIEKEKKKPNRTEVNMQRQYAQIERQGVLYEKNKKNHSLHTDPTKNETMYDTIQHEISQTLASKGWRAMDLCFKWKYIQDYLGKQPFSLSPQDHSSLASKVHDKYFSQNIEYDKSSQSIKRLHFKCQNGEEI